MENSILYEYLGIIEPNGFVNSAAMDMKIRCRNDYGWNSAVWSKPHFTVCNIIQPLLNEEKLTKCFERNTLNISPFNIHLYGFDYFPSPTCTLYVKVKDDKEFSEMVKYIRKFSSPILRPVRNYTPHYTRKAHLTIAKRIFENDFMKVWPNWEKAVYQSSTNADRMLLLRRPLSRGYHKFEQIGDYPFLAKGAINPQMKLF